jgi:hypothetical protein
VNAKVDYTLLDRWRHSHAWRSGTRLDRSTAPAASRESHASEPSLQNEREQGVARVVHLPLGD